ncbi:hypothetical protein Efla_001420 [Eimeria flavescens]
MRDFLEFFKSEVLGSAEGAATSPQNQVEALKRVPWLCSALGPTQTRLQLLPLLAEVQQQVLDKDELLSLFAVQWRTAARMAAADPTADEAAREAVLADCAQALAQLAETEEKCIRNEAVDSLLYLPSLLPAGRRSSFVRQRLFPICLSLATAESSLFSRCSAARLLPHVARYVESERPPPTVGPRGAPCDAKIEKRLPPQESDSVASATPSPSAASAAGAAAAAPPAAATAAAATTAASQTEQSQEMFEGLCIDESFIVRREAIQELPNLVRGALSLPEAAGSEDLQLTALRILREAFGETSDFLRAAAARSAVDLATAFPPPKDRLLDVALPQQELVAWPLSGGCESPVPVEGEKEKQGVFSLGEALSLQLLSASDPSWRVRAVAAKQMMSVIAFAPLNFDDFFPSLCLLLKDTALRDVRLEAVRCVAQVAPLLPSAEVTSKLAPLVRQLLTDFIPQSRPVDLWVDVGTTAASAGAQNAAFEAAVEAALAVGQKASPAAAKAIVKEVIATLRQGDIFAAMCIAKRVPEFCSLCRQPKGVMAAAVCTAEKEAALLVQALCEVRQQTGQTGDWRLRLEVIRQTPAIASVVSSSFFRTWLSGIFLEALCDPINEVREAAVDVCRELVCAVGTRWATETLLPRLVDCQEGAVVNPQKDGLSGASDGAASAYLQRIVVQHSLPKLVGVLPRDVVTDKLVPLLVQGLHDAVSNVRLTAAEMLRIIVAERTLPSSTLGEFIPCMRLFTGIFFLIEILVSPPRRHLEILGADEDLDQSIRLLVDATTRQAKNDLSDKGVEGRSSQPIQLSPAALICVAMLHKESKSSLFFCASLSSKHCLQFLIQVPLRIQRKRTKRGCVTTEELK